MLSPEFKPGLVQILKIRKSGLFQNSKIRSSGLVQISKIRYLGPAQKLISFTPDSPDLQKLKRLVQIYLF